jgi:hypothetical protein
MKKEGKINNKTLVFLGVGLLLVLIIGFMIWSSSFKTKSDSISIQCESACDTAQTNSFCLVERKVNNNLEATCKTLAEDSQYSEYGVKPCPTISCESQSTDQTCVTGLGGTWELPIAGGCSQSGTKIRRQVTSTDEPPTQGQICCR